MLFDNVKKILEEKKISVVDFEAAIKVQRGTFYKWKDHSPSIAKVKEAAEFLGVTLDELMK